MDEVTSYIMNSVKPIDYQDDYSLTEFAKKIKFNKLEQAKCYLKTAQYQIGNLDDFFRNNAPFLKEKLKLRFVRLYEESKKKYPKEIKNNGDLSFFYILKKASSDTNCKSLQDAVLVLMACFFEGCDIFETEENNDIAE